MLKNRIQIRFICRSVLDSLARAQLVGGLSLSALLVGGTILIFFSGNILLSINSYRSGRSGNGGINGASRIPFTVGSHHGVQVWLAILGVAFGMLSFGMNGSFTHFFDCWSSSRATQSPGLDYARYLNTQPHSPVFLGVRGFGCAILIRNIVLGLGILAAAGYSFAVVDVPVDTYQHVDPSLINLQIPPLAGLLEAGLTSPWFGDKPLSSRNRAFLHQLQNPDRGPPDEANVDELPARIIMIGWAGCHQNFSLHDTGILFTREVVLVATRMEDTKDPGLWMSAESSGWLRVENATSRWIRSNDTGVGQVVVDYRSLDGGQIEIQWAESGDWLQSGSEKQSVLRKTVFEIKIGLAVVRRFIFGQDCSMTSDEDGASLAAEVITTAGKSLTLNNHQDLLLANRNWINSLLLDNKTGPREGVSGLVRGAMTLWAANGVFDGEETVRYYLGHALYPESKHSTIQHNNNDVLEDTVSDWMTKNANETTATHHMNSSLFDFPEAMKTNATEAARSRGLSDKYPVYAGTRLTGQTGSYQSVMYLFMFLGLFSYLLVALRMYVGPAELTSWMGQHVYLAGLGAKVPKEATDHLADGRQPAVGAILGRVRIKDNEPLTRLRLCSVVFENHAADYGLYKGRCVNGL